MSSHHRDILALFGAVVAISIALTTFGPFGLVGLIGLFAFGRYLLGDD